MPEAAKSRQFPGSGTYDGNAASFCTCVQDNGDGAHAADSDRLYVECTAGCSYNTGSRTPDDSPAGEPGRDGRVFVS